MLGWGGCGLRKIQRVVASLEILEFFLSTVGIFQFLK